MIITGSVAAYKALELIRLFRKRGVVVDVILTGGGQEFITPLAISSLTGRETYTDLFSLKDEVEMGHIQLSRKANAILVAPASADMLAKMQAGICDDLATTALLATDKPVFIAPAMNHRMWLHPSTQRNVQQLEQDGVTLIPPEVGEMACGETGPGRMAALETILHYFESEAVRQLPAPHPAPLSGHRAIVTAGPTHEPIDPVRFLGNHSSGKQGIAIATALAEAGAEVELILGPSQENVPTQLTTTRVTTAAEMHQAVENALPASIAICAAAVADWRARPAAEKMKKTESDTPPELILEQTPDILAWLSQQAVPRPQLVIGFAAETERVDDYARQKLERKQCDWLLANDVSGGQIFGQDRTKLLLLPHNEIWQGTKAEIAQRLVAKIAEDLSHPNEKESA